MCNDLVSPCRYLPPSPILLHWAGRLRAGSTLQHLNRPRPKSCTPFQLCSLTTGLELPTIGAEDLASYDGPVARLVLLARCPFPVTWIVSNSTRWHAQATGDESQKPRKNLRPGDRNALLPFALHTPGKCNAGTLIYELKSNLHSVVSYGTQPRTFQAFDESLSTICGTCGSCRPDSCSSQSTGSERLYNSSRPVSMQGQWNVLHFHHRCRSPDADEHGPNTMDTRGSGLAERCELDRPIHRRKQREPLGAEVCLRK